MARRPEEFVAEIKNIHPTIMIKGVYTRAQDSVQVLCMECGREWSPKAYSLLQGKGCPHCSAIKGARNNSGKTGVKTLEMFKVQLAQIAPDIIVTGKYLNTHTNVNCECKICSHTWAAKPYSLLQGHGCPRCSKSGTSFMEQLILVSFSQALGNTKVLSRDKSIIGMELDIVVPEYKIAIEPGNWMLHKRFIKRDAEKRKRCQEIGYRLITIYDKYPKESKKPFDKDCYVFPYDLNKADHTYIQELIITLLDSIGIQTHASDFDWDTLERMAYDNSKAKTHEDFVAKLMDINSTIDILEKYENSNKQILVQCRVCGFTWHAVPASLLSGDGCRKCGTVLAHKKTMKDHTVFVEELGKINPDIEVLGEYTGRHNQIEVRCKICGYEWSATAGSLLRGSGHKGMKTVHRFMMKEKNESKIEL